VWVGGSGEELTGDGSFFRDLVIGTGGFGWTDTLTPLTQSTVEVSL
jgi:hypothetical protein